MIDIHSHILPGLDDGAESFEESIMMARMAVESGINVLVATPHCSDSLKREVRERVLILRDMLQEAEIPLKVCMGMEIFGTVYTSRLLREKKLVTLNNSRYPLVEFSFSSSGEEETDILQDMLWSGYVPVVAHPERYKYIRENPELINIWAKMGCLFQINKGSLLGKFGGDIKKMADSLLKRGFVTAVASDSHSAEVRTPWMKDAYNYVADAVGYSEAEKLLNHNPRTILKNDTIRSVEPEWYR